MARGLCGNRLRISPSHGYSTFQNRTATIENPSPPAVGDAVFVQRKAIRMLGLARLQSLPAPRADSVLPATVSCTATERHQTALRDRAGASAGCAGGDEALAHASGSDVASQKPFRSDDPVTENDMLDSRRAGMTVFRRQTPEESRLACAPGDFLEHRRCEISKPRATPWGRRRKQWKP